MSEWKEVRLGDVTSILGDGIHGTPNYSEEGDYFFINGSNLYEGEIKIKPDTKRVSEEEYQKYKKELNDRTLLFSINGTVGNVAKYNGEPCILGKSACYFNVLDTVDKNYIYYIVSSPSFIKSMSNLANGTTIKNVSLKQMRDKKFLIPSLSTQRRIASILSSLDDKIAINRRICENLEAQAQALFKHWFIDFAPFKNGKFVESELGMIPEGWRVVTLDEATSKFGTGLNPRRNFKLGCGKNYYVTIKNMIDNRVVLDNKCDFVDDEAIKVIQKRSKLTKGDLLFSGIGTIGRVAMVVDEPLNWNTSESVFNMHPAEGFSTEFIYVLLLSKPLQNYVKTNSQGAVQQGIRMASLKAYKFPYPQYDIKEFNEILKDIISKKTILEKECDTLSALRDTLLPKLMSGEIKV